MKTKNTFMPLLVRGFFILMILAVEILPFLYSAPASATSWYNSAWAYRKSFTITHASGILTNNTLGIMVYYGNGTDGSISIDYGTTYGKVYLNGLCQADFDDIRFTTNDGITLCDYYTENVSASAHSFMHVKFPSIGTSATTFYIYFGNSGVSSASNGTNAFMKFSDMEFGSVGDNITGNQGWTVLSAANYDGKVSTDHAYSGTRSAIFAPSASLYAADTQSLTADTQSYAIQFRFWKENATVCNNLFFHGNGTKRIRFYVTDAEDVYYVNSAGASVDTTANINADAWNTFEVKDINFAAYTYDLWLNAAQIADNIEMNTAAGDGNVIRLMVDAQTVGQDMYIDYFTVRAWEPTPPVWASWSSTDYILPSVNVGTPTSITSENMSLQGNITSLGGSSNCTSRGWIWSNDNITSDPGNVAPATTGLSVYTENGTYTTGTYNHTITGLIAGYPYFNRAWTYNGIGYDYSDNQSIGIATPNAPSAFSVTAASNSLSLSWTKAAYYSASTYIETYINYSTVTYPTSQGSGTLGINWTTASSGTISGLTPGVTYYLSAWSRVTATVSGAQSAVSSYVTGLGIPIGVPTISTGISTGRSLDWAVVNGSVSSFGYPVSMTIRGFDYGTTTAYGSDVLETNLSGFTDATFSNVLTGLSSYTTYHYRSKAYNGAWAYGNDLTLSTRNQLLPIAEYMPATCDSTAQVYGNRLIAQIFTTDNQTPMQASVVRIKIKKETADWDNPIYISLRKATSDNISSISLATGTIDPDIILVSTPGTSDNFTIAEITLSNTVNLDVNSKYAIVAYSPVSVYGFYYWGKLAIGTYSGGQSMLSTDNGLTWTSSNNDLWFQVLGTETLQIQDAKIYMSYKEDNDWLIVCRYLNTVAPYYDIYDIKKYFAVQLTDSSGNIKGQNVLPGWGNKVASIYQAATPADNLTWGGSYRLRIQGLFSPYPYTEYVFQDTDWQGDDMVLLDNWIITSGTVIGTYYNTTMTTYVSGKGEVLNSTGGAILSNGISGLEIERPDIFQISTSSMTYAGTTTPQSFRQEKQSAFDTNWGPQATAMWQNWEDLLGVNKEYFAAAAFFIAVLVLALVAFPAGHTTASLVLSFIFLGAGIGFGVDLIYLILIGLCASFLLFKQFFMDK